jgi:hypothetical protein
MGLVQEFSTLMPGYKLGLLNQILWFWRAWVMRRVHSGDSEGRSATTTVAEVKH